MLLTKGDPHNEKLEETAIGIFISEAGTFKKNYASLNEGLFHTLRLKKIYAALQSLYNADAPIDKLSVIDQLRKQGDLEYVSLSYVTFLEYSPVQSGSIEYSIQLLKEWQIKRESYQFSLELNQNSASDTYDPLELIERIESFHRKLNDILTTGSMSGVKTLKQVYIETAVYLNKIALSKDGMMGVSTGYPELDAALAGWKKGDLVVIAGRPGMGKTAFTVNSLYRAAVFYKKKVLFVSLEMSNEQIGVRQISMQTGINSKTLQLPKQITVQEWERIQRGEAGSGQENFLIYTPKHSNPSVLMAEIRSLVHKHGIEAVAVDYLQLLSFSSKKSTTDAIGEATKGFKNLAKELEVPILLLSQLNRKNEDRSDKEPQLSDLRASGDIEQDADTVLMLHRPEYYKIEAFMDSGESTKGIAQVLIRKGRQSGTGEVRLNWQETNTVFYGQGETSSVYYQPGGESEIPF